MMNFQVGESPLTLQMVVQFADSTLALQRCIAVIFCFFLKSVLNAGVV